MVIEKINPLEFFRGHVNSALRNQKVESAELTVFYLVHLLGKFVQPADDLRRNDAPLVTAYREATTLSSTQRRILLQEIGDRALFISGFFPDRFKRMLVDIDYYIAFGETSYKSLAAREDDALSEVFCDLAKRFVVYMDVLSEVSEHTHCTTNSDLLRLYERWQKTGSRHTGQLLIQKGLVPTDSPKKVRFQ